MPTSHIERHLTLLEHLRNRPDAAQRDMAEAVGLSLGMTNLLLKQLAEKGWMLVQKINARNIRYVLTPAGMAELSRRSVRFLGSTIQTIANCRVQLERLVMQVKGDGYKGISLIGDSELAFVLDFLCDRLNLGYSNQPTEGWFTVYAESRGDLSPNLLEYLQGLPPDQSGT